MFYTFHIQCITYSFYFVQFLKSIISSKDKAQLESSMHYFYQPNKNNPQKKWFLNIFKGLPS